MLRLSQSNLSLRLRLSRGTSVLSTFGGTDRSSADASRTCQGRDGDADAGRCATHEGGLTTRRAGGVTQVADAVAQLDGGVSQMKLRHWLIGDARALDHCRSSTAAPHPSVIRIIYDTEINYVRYQTRSHPEMVGDMSRVTLNFDLSKIPFVDF